MVAAKLVTFVALLGCTLGEYADGGYGGHGGQEASYGYAQPQHHPQPSHHGHQAHYGPQVHYKPAIAIKNVHAVEKHVVDYYARPKYTFSYGVNDHHTGDIKHQHESRDGDVVKGEYSLHEADGSIRTVHYTADPIHGFNAVVEKTPGHHPPHVVKHVAPVVTKAIIPSYPEHEDGHGYGHAPAHGHGYGHAPAHGHGYGPAHGHGGYDHGHHAYAVPVVKHVEKALVAAPVYGGHHQNSLHQEEGHGHGNYGYAVSGHTSHGVGVTHYAPKVVGYKKAYAHVPVHHPEPVHHHGYEQGHGHGHGYSQGPHHSYGNEY